MGKGFKQTTGCVISSSIFVTVRAFCLNQQTMCMKLKAFWGLLIAARKIEKMKWLKIIGSVLTLHAQDQINTEEFFMLLLWSVDFFQN